MPLLRFLRQGPAGVSECSGNRILSYGLGTEKLTAEIQELFPQARVARMDSDTTSSRGSHERILQAFGRGEIEILVGTQMITKGHDFPDVTSWASSPPTRPSTCRTSGQPSEPSSCSPRYPEGAQGREPRCSRHPDAQPRPLCHPAHPHP